MDHASIKEIVRTSAATQYSTRIDKFRMLLAPFIDDKEVFYRPGKDMANVDPPLSGGIHSEAVGDISIAKSGR